MLPPNSEPVVGKAANDATERRRVSSATSSARRGRPSRPSSTAISRFQRGTFTVIATPKGDGDRVEVNGNFMRIYQRQANGEWRMTRDMFNSSTPLTQSLSTGQ